jgi:methionyl-tRNA formyltransferase
MPGGYFEHRGERIKILQAEISGASGPAGTLLDDHLTIACAQGSIVPTLVQRAGRAAMSTEELLRGFPIPAGTRLS